MMLSRSRPAESKKAEPKKAKEISWQSFVGKRDYTGALGVLNFETGAPLPSAQNNCSRALGAGAQQCALGAGEGRGLARGKGSASRCSRSSVPRAHPWLRAQMWARATR